MSALLLTIIQLLACFGKLTWHSILPSPLPTGYANLAIGYDVNAGSLWMIGGRVSANWYKKVMEYNINSSTFIPHSDFTANNIQFHGQIYTQINNSIWFILDQSFGVFVIENQTLTLTYPYTYNGITVTIPLKTYYTNVYPNQPCLTSYKSRYLIIVGGDNLRGNITNGKQFQIYDIETNTWYYNNLPTLTTSRSLLCCAIVNDYLYAIGGYSITHYDDTLEKIYVKDILNIENEEWHNLSNTLTDRRSYHSCATIGDDIYVVGGYDGNGNTLSSVDRINTIDDSVVKDSDISSPLRGSGIGAVGRFLYVIGGQFGSTVTDVFQYGYKPPTLSPTSVPSLSPTRHTYNPAARPSIDSSDVSSIEIMVNIICGTIIFAVI